MTAHSCAISPHLQVCDMSFSIHHDMHNRRETWCIELASDTWRLHMQALKRICDTELTRMRSKPESDTSLAQAFRTEKASVLSECLQHH